MSLLDLAGKKGLVVGIANDNSIAYGCAKAFHAAGADVAITYLNAKAEPYVRPLAEKLASPIIVPCDIREPGQLDAVFEHVRQQWGRLVKQLTYLADAQGAGLVLGARVPIVLTSRADTVLARMASCAVALVAARRGRLAVP
jgi:enoyl-[acyl-carrier-protein] reductase (NADH)